MSSYAPSPSLRNLFSELEQMLQTETEAHVSARARAAERVQAEHLNQSLRRLRQAAGFAEIAAILCDACAPFCNDCAIFRVDIDNNMVTGECRRGTDRQTNAGFREVHFAVPEAAAFAGAIESREPVVAICSAAEISPALLDFFGHAADDKVHLFPLTIDGTTAGILYIAGAVESAALELLAQSAAMVLESRQEARQKPLHAAAPDMLLRIEPAPPAWDSLSSEDRSLHLRAQRFARVQVAEMRLYRPDAVKSGRARGDLYSALQEAIDSARLTYRQTFISATPTMADYFHRELLCTLANDNAAWLGEKYPGPLL
jgi:hypothetical protein